MAFTNLTEDSVHPVKIASKGQIDSIFCGNFKGELSSITGIIHKSLYIARIDTLTGEPTNPLIKIVCGIECKDGCINLYKK